MKLAGLVATRCIDDAKSDWDISAVSSCGDSFRVCVFLICLQSAVAKKEVAFDDEDDEASIESFSDDELSAEMESVPVKSASRASRSSKKTHKNVHQKADVNVVKVEMENLEDDVALATGDPIRCDGCGVLMSALSKVVEPKKEEDEQQGKGKEEGEEEEEEELPADLIPAPPLHAKFAKAIPVCCCCCCCCCVFSFPGICDDKTNTQLLFFKKKTGSF